MKHLERLVVCEDDADIRAILEIALVEVAGLDVRMAHDGVQGLALIREWRPDLVLSDVLMPNGNGTKLLENLQADAELRDIPVVLMTARSEPKHVSAYLAGGAVDVVFKPFDPITLGDQLESIVAGRVAKA